jgi:Uncharacterized protein conserved in bacteria
VGAELHHLQLSKNASFKTFEGKGLFAHKVLIQAEGTRQASEKPEQQPLWHYDHAPGTKRPQTLTFIPWFSWTNRGEGEMRIWVNEG